MTIFLQCPLSHISFPSSMNLSKIHHPPPILPILQTTCITPPLFLSLNTSRVRPLPSISLSTFARKRFTPLNASRVQSQTWENGELGENLAQDGAVYQNTLRLVECSMFAAVAGLAYFLSNSLAIENYFGCFFALPIVISSMRWGVAAGRKTMVATGMLLLVLSGPVKALTYLLMHGLLGFTMGTLWRLGTNWGLSVFLCAFVRAFGAIGYVLISSSLIRENILALITVNIHTSLTFIVTSLGINAIPSMNAIYAIFGTLLILNCGFFVFLLHILYGVLFVRLGMKGSVNLPRWLNEAI